MPSRSFFTSASVAAKMFWILAVTSARFVSSFDFVLPLSATSAASAAAFVPCMPATASEVCAAACVLLCWMTSCSCSRNCAGAVSACSAAVFLSARACWNSGSLDSRQLRFRHLRVGHLLVGLMLAGLEVELLRRHRLGCGSGGRDRRRLSRLFLGPSA